MLQPKSVFNLLRNKGFDLFAGVPDSLLKDFCAYVTDHTSSEQHVITANEGNAIALAAGHYLGSGSPALVYMQNSGLGNAVNPLTSLTDPEVYSIPMLLMIGWRGEPGIKDEPQHVKQGRVMTDLLDSLEIPWYAVDSASENFESLVSDAVTKMNNIKAPVALLISKGAFETYKLNSEEPTHYEMNREQAIERILTYTSKKDLIVATTGMASRELYEIRVKKSEQHSQDFLTVGAMGHTGSIALGLAKAQPRRRVFCIDGDGSVLMHMGALGVIGKSESKNLSHVVINNGAHDSVGGQPTIGFEIDLAQIAQSSGYAFVCSVETVEELNSSLSQLDKHDGPHFIEIKVNKGSRKNLGRPKSTPIENKTALMSALGIVDE